MIKLPAQNNITITKCSLNTSYIIETDFDFDDLKEKLQEHIDENDYFEDDDDYILTLLQPEKWIERKKK